MNERRSQARLLDCELAIISWSSPWGTAKQIASVDNLSSRGMGVLIDDPIPIHASVLVSYDGADQLTGTVKHQSRRSGRYLIGIEFTEDSRDSTLHFQPEFLTGA